MKLLFKIKKILKSNFLFNFIKFQAIFLMFILFYFLSIWYNDPVSFKPVKNQNFNVNHNVLVFLHIQKTGGSELDTFLIRSLAYFDATMECRILSKDQKSQIKKIRNFKENGIKNNICINNKTGKQLTGWYWGRKTGGWPCGVHPHYTILKACLKKNHPQLNADKDFLIFTMLREPIKRYLSEWNHASRGGHWIGKSQRDHCLYKNYRKCFKGKENWKSVKLKEFIDCEYNLANNRQTLLLSDSGYDCENKTGEQMLEEAKNNLQSLTFFGLTEYQNYTQQLFLKIFSKNFKLAKEFAQSNRTFAETFIKKQNDKEQIPYLEEIKKLNRLDIELYSFAKELFFKRLKDLRIV